MNQNIDNIENQIIEEGDLFYEEEVMLLEKIEEMERTIQFGQ